MSATDSASHIGAPRILLADADAFFVSVARLEDPDGVGKEPLLIVGGSAKGRGVVTSASYATREYGVRSGMPTARALKLCPNAVSIPVPGSACRQKSRDIKRVLERYTPVVGAASIDEWYLDMTGTEELYHHEPLARTAARIRADVLEQTGIPVSIGGGTSRLIAKLAAKRAKPHRHAPLDGVCVILPGQEQTFLAEHQLVDIPGVGPKFGERLARRGLRSVVDALEYDEDTLKRWFGERTGSWLYARIRGASTTVVSNDPGRKSMSRETTFSIDLHADEDLEREILRLAARVASDLRSENLRTRTVTVKFRDPDFTTRQASRTLPRAVDADKPILVAAKSLLRKLRKERKTGARLLGVALSNLESPGERPPQLSLFDRGGLDALENDRDRTLAQTLDRVNQRFGGGHLKRASEVKRHR